ncbi:MAG: HAMP domain-containing sensor histidine kinase [Candidatus Eiseniibacteriota bacterium]
MIAASVTAGWLVLARAPLPDPVIVLIWALAFATGELMHLRTPTGNGNVSMAAALHLAAVPIVGAPVLFLAAWIARLVANLIVQRQPWYKAVFNAAQVSLAVVGARFCYEALVGELPVALSRDTMPVVVPGLVGATLVYYVVNVGLVCGVLALVTGSSPFRVWRQNYGYRVELVSSVALFLMAPVVTITYQTADALGVALFFLPMLFIRDACRRYIALEKTQSALIGSERLAAKGEMAASVGHELNNFMMILSGNLQLVQMNDAQLTPEERGRHLKKSLEQLRRMAALSKGLMDFSGLETRPMPTDLETLVRELVEFLEPQNRFDGITVSVHCDPAVGTVLLDAAQIQQVMVNLLHNAADAIREAGGPDGDGAPAGDGRIEVRVRRRPGRGAGSIEITVDDNGPGVADELRRRIFEPTVTTRVAGHGFGLSTVYRIVRNHGGTVEVGDADGGGARFRVELPCASADATSDGPPTGHRRAA